MDDLTQRVLDQCRELGFARAGVARPDPTEYGDELRQWLAAGKHGTMEYLARHEPLLLDPRELLPDVRSIICVADRYSDGRRDRSALEDDRPHGRIARYARGDDYHRVIKRRLFELADALRGEHHGHSFRACVDTAPLLEREYAQRAGIGSVGKHTLVNEPGGGSCLLVGALLTSLPLTPSRPSSADVCGSCTRCIDACPTDAITPFSVDARRCISYLTIEHRERIDPAYHRPIGDWLFGCDICQEVCPHNQPTRRSRRAGIHEAYESDRASFDLLEVLGWSVNDRSNAFIKSAMKRATLSMMKRNALIVAGNAMRARPSEALLTRIRQLIEDENETDLVRDAARTALEQLENEELADFASDRTDASGQGGPFDQPSG